MSYNAKKAEAARARGGGGGGTGTATAEVDNIADTVDLQEQHGNDYIQDMMDKKDGKAGPSQKVPLPSELRWKLLSSNDLQSLSALVFSQASPSESMSKEIQALASVYFNRWEHLQAHPGDQAIFGAPNFEGLIFKLQQQMPLHYDPARLMQFSNAAKFGGKLDDDTDVDTAVHATRAADEALAGINPFPKEYVFVSLTGQSPDPKRTDSSSHIKLGRLHFWAFSESGKIPPGEKTREEEKQAEEEHNQMMASGSAEPV